MADPRLTVYIYIYIYILIYEYVYLYIHIKLPRNLTFSRKNIWRKPPSWGRIRQVETSFLLPFPSFKFRRSQVDLAKSLPSMLEDLGEEVHHLLPESEKAPNLSKSPVFWTVGFFGPRKFSNAEHDFFFAKLGWIPTFENSGIFFNCQLKMVFGAHLVG